MTAPKLAVNNSGARRIASDAAPDGITVDQFRRVLNDVSDRRGLVLGDALKRNGVVLCDWYGVRAARKRLIMDALDDEEIRLIVTMRHQLGERFFDISHWVDEYEWERGLPYSVGEWHDDERAA